MSPVRWFRVKSLSERVGSNKPQEPLDPPRGTRGALELSPLQEGSGTWFPPSHWRKADRMTLG